MGFTEIFLIIISSILILYFIIYYIDIKRQYKLKEHYQMIFIRRWVKTATIKLKEWIKLIPLKKTLYISLGLVLLMVVVLSWTRETSINYYVETKSLYSEYKDLGSTNEIKTYKELITNEYKNYQEYNINQIFLPDNYLGNIIGANDSNYKEEVLLYEDFIGDSSMIAILENNSNITFNVGNISNGLYHLAIDYYEINNLIDQTQIGIKINDINPFYEAMTLVLPSRWEFETDEFALDRYKNEIQPSSSKIVNWTHHKINDLKGLHQGLYSFYLEEDDEITIEYVNAELLIGRVYFVKDESLITYEEYISNKEITKEKLYEEVSAKDISFRNDPSIRLRSDQNASNMYYDTQHLLLNVVYSESFNLGGQYLSYTIDVKKSGYYNLAFKYRQNLIKDMPVFRNVYIDGEIPFKELEAVAFPYTTSFKNRTLTDENNNPYFIYLEEGTHEIALEAVLYPYRNAIEGIKYIMNQIQELALDVKRYTAGGTDSYRDWDIEEFFPNAKDDIISWSYMLDEMYDELKELTKNSNPAEIVNLKVGANRLRQIAKNINKLPSKMIQFSDGDSSVNQLIGLLMQRLLTSPLELERTVVYNNTKLKKPYTNMFKSLYEGTYRLILSFINNPYSANKPNKNDLIVWVNHPRQYIEIMQALIDQKYEGDYRVTLSQMPDQNKLILANTSGKAPDLAIGVDHWIPYDFSVRGAALDLREFEGYEELVKNFSKGAMLPYIFEDGVYGLPETQNFWVTYYRKDILDSIGINEVPDTWEDIIKILPLLQSYGLNYFIPLAQFTGLKPFVATLPFIYQFGGDLYTEDGMQTTINTEETLEGITLLSELFTLYNLPKYTASFYNNFRYGNLPIGVSDLSTYLLLQTAARELDGLWSMALHPGVYNEEKDEIIRYSASGAQSSMIMASTNKKEEAWDFLSWWMSTDIQSEYAFLLQSTYGKAYFWNTANLNAFETIGMPKVYRDIILEQWNYAIEAARIPGTYMVEREISNAWTNIVFENVNPRQALDNAVRISNREILYKMAEFGYVDNGVVLKDYPVPNIYNVHEWLVERNG